MNTTEREALMKLWERIPETKPACITVMNATSGKQLWRGNPNVSENASRWSDSEAAALARDAIVEWLIDRVEALSLGKGNTGDRDTWASVHETKKTHRPLEPTTLLCLIAAANAVADGEQK